MKKPGWKTSEFWLGTLAALVVAFLASGVLPPEHIAIKIAGMVATTLAALGYGAMRTAGKIKEMKEVAKLAEDPSRSDPTSPASPK